MGGEDWCRYDELGQMLDHVETMSNDFAWRGSTPGPISLGWWLEDVYNYAVTQLDPQQVCMGLPLYGGFWVIHHYPEDPGGMVRQHGLVLRRRGIFQRLSGVRRDV